MSASSQTVCYWSKRWVERVRPGKRGAHPAITEFNQEDFEMFFRFVRRPETSVRPQPPSPRSPQFPVASCLVKIHSSSVLPGFLRAHGPSESATSECKRGCGRTMYFKICGLALLVSAGPVVLAQAGLNIFGFLCIHITITSFTR